MNNNLKNIYRSILENKIKNKNTVNEMYQPPIIKTRGRRPWWSIGETMIRAMFKDRYRHEGVRPYWTILHQGFGGSGIKSLLPKGLNLPPWMTENADLIAEWFIQQDGRVLIKTVRGTWHYMENTPNGPRPGPALPLPPNHTPGIVRPPTDPLPPPGSDPNADNVRPPWQPLGIIPFAVPDIGELPPDWPGSVQQPNGLPPLPGGQPWDPYQEYQPQYDDPNDLAAPGY